MPTVVLPTLHVDQVRAFRAHQKSKRLVIRAGRRWGKTDLCKTLACDTAIKSFPVGWFAPDYKISSEAFTEISNTLDPVLKQSSKVEGVQRTSTGGRIDFWTLDNERAGRSRKYKLVIIDEAAFTKPNMKDIWEQSIEPTLLDLDGSVVIASNTNGVNPENFMYQVCTQEKYGFTEFHAPTSANPLVPLRRPGESEEAHAKRRLETLEELRAKKHPLVFRQEYLAEFVDFSGVAFFTVDKFLDANGHPLPYPSFCDSVYAVIDTAIKAGSENDGTAVTYYSTSEHFGARVMILDYDIIQVEGNSLKDWLPSVLGRLEQLARECNARMGVAGVWIEDMNSGTILLQHANANGMNVHAIDTALTAKGKDGRALAVSSFHYQGLCKISAFAYNKVVEFKEVVQNHFLTQVVGFRIGDKDAAKRADDLLDTYLYGLSIALGNNEGF